MRAVLGEEQELVVETARRMAANGLAAAQAVLAGGVWPAEPDRSLMADWTGLGIPEEQGGSGGSLVDLALVVRELACTLTPNRYIGHMMALQAAIGAGLPVADGLDGSQSWCLAVSEAAAQPFGPFSATLAGGKVCGRKPGVPFGAVADLAVAALNGNQLALVRPDARQAVLAADVTAQCADLVFENASALAVGQAAVNGLLRASAVLAADLCGVAQGAINQGVAYAGNRFQFGKPIGAFQGVAYQLADALVGAETAWSLTLYACWAIDTGNPDAAKAVHAAKARAAEAAVFAAERALHVHGGMGMTWEAPPHLFLRRALARGAWLGGTHWHRRQVGAALLKRAGPGA
jgi:alkylation response protein AidB-like acyl-CoA dehydrogenase